MVRRLSPWLGLLVMVASLVWLQLYPDTWMPPAPSTKAPTPETISLVVLNLSHGGQDSGVILHEGMVEKI